MRKDNRGVTLVELIVMVAIGTIFSGVILTFAAGAVRSYRHTSGGAQAQIEMQDALDQLESLAMNANLSMYYTKGENTTTDPGEKIEKDSDMESPLNQTKTLFIGSEDESTGDGQPVYAVIIWDADSGRLTLSTQGLRSGTGTASIGTSEILAENITQFSADIHHAADRHTVLFKLVTKVNGRENKKTETVTLRNDIVIAAPGAE
ncbi:MAG: prepilin-type N-terminal cleavage/methylation domain-containing protein [Eubacterium sp.]|nr:prepilin-type N-terminal cleavage/methylation domain-containing protein [Eubacterium sp.]